MSTNYYLYYNLCESCGRYDIIHIGKCSAGWKFLFHWHHNIRNIEEYKDRMKQPGATIMNEYDDVISYEDFWKMVNDHQNEDEHEEYENIDGYSFVSYDFL